MPKLTPAGYTPAQSLLYDPLSSSETPKECPNERFTEEYNFGDRQKAVEYLDEIDVDYENGYFILRAAQEGDIEMLSALLAKRPKVRLTEALKAAACEGDIECAEVLIEYGVDPKPLIGTDAYNNYPRMKKFLDQKLKENKDNSPVLETAKECRNEKFINEYRFGDRKKALADLPFINPDHDNGYLLLMAIQERDIKLLKALLERGARVGLDDALGEAARKGDIECAKVLIQAGANPKSFIGTDAYALIERALIQLDADPVLLRGTAANMNYFNMKNGFKKVEEPNRELPQKLPEQTLSESVKKHPAVSSPLTSEGGIHEDIHDLVATCKSGSITSTTQGKVDFIADTETELEEVRAKLWNKITTQIQESGRHANAIANSTNDQEHEFISLPLQAKRLAITFLEEFRQFCAEEEPLVSEKSALYTVYQRFIETKYQRLLKDKVGLKDYDQLACIVKPSIIKRLDKEHQLFASNVLFSTPEVIREGSPAIHIEFIKAAGIIQFIQGKPHFMHRTFAEYFAAKFLVACLEKPSASADHQHAKDIVIRQIFKDRNSVLRTFIEELIDTSQSEPLKQTWRAICHCNLLPNNLRRFTLDSTNETSDVALANIASKPNWAELKDILDRSIFSWISYDRIEEMVNYADAFCKAVLEIANSEKVADSLIFLNHVMQKAKLYTVKNEVAGYLDKVFWHYIASCNDEGLLFDRNLINAFADIGYSHRTADLKRALAEIPKINDLHGFLQTKPGITPAFIADLTEAKILYLSFIKDLDIDKALFTKLKEVYPIFEDVPSYQALFMRAAKHFADDIRDFFNTIFSKDPSLFWLKRDGMRIVGKFNILTPTMATLFSAVLQAEQINGYHRVYANNIWHGLLLPLLNEVDPVMVKQGINRVALIKMCTHFMQFYETNDKSFLFTPALTGIQNLLKVIEIVLNRAELNKEMLALCITQLYLLNKMGLQLIDTGPSLLVLDPSSEFEYTLSLTHKKFIQALVLYKADRAKSEEAFVQQCAQVIRSIMGDSTSIVGKLTRTTSDPSIKKIAHYMPESRLFHAG